MKLLGDWNWYLPAWLEWLPRSAPRATPPYRHEPTRLPPEPEEPGAAKEPEPTPVPA